MTSEIENALRRWHRLQKERDSCVAACRAIIDASMGGDGEEVPSYPSLEGEALNPSLPESISLLVARVRQGEYAIVTVYGPVWMDVARLKKMRSPYGDLGTGRHAIVLVAVAPERMVLVVLDPYFPDTLQPVYVSRDDFAAAWTGQVEFVER